jgi:hypothetical protein
MAFTATDLETLERAIGRGVLTVEYADRRVTYQSLDAMRRLRREMQDEINAAAGAPRARTMRVTQSGRGY